MITKLDELLEAVKSAKKMRVAIAAAENADALEAAAEARKKGIVEPVLVGNRAEIERLISENSIELDGVKMIDAVDFADAAGKACKAVSDGQADFIMKGALDTATMLKAVLNREYGLRTGSLLSHVMIYESPCYHKLILLTDGGMNIAPDLDAKVSIIKNAAICAKALGIERVKVAALAAKESVNEKMPATVEAAKLAELSKQGEFGPDVVVEGPLALDLAVSKHAAEIKHVEGEVPGDADVFLVHDIEMGNGIGKSATYLGGSLSAGVIMGAKVPVVLTSRADDAHVKLCSIALAAIVASHVSNAK